MNKYLLILGISFMLMIMGVMPIQANTTPTTLANKTPTSPEGSEPGPIIGQLPGSGRALAVWGDYAYVGFGEDFVVIDISDKTMPEEIGRLPLNQTILDIEIQDHFAYVGTFEGLHIVDISQRNDPQLHSIFGSTMMAHVNIQGVYGYILSSEGLFILDMAHAPQLSIMGQWKKTIITPLDLDISEDYAFIVGDSTDFIFTLFIIDITSQIQPMLVHSQTERANRIALTHNRYLEIDNGCSQICETSFTASSWKANNWQFRHLYTYRWFDSASTRALTTDGLYAYVGKEVGLYVYNIYDGTFVKWFDTSGSISDIQIAGDYIYAISADYEDWPNPIQEGGFYILPAPVPAYHLYLPITPNH